MLDTRQAGSFDEQDFIATSHEHRSAEALDRMLRLQVFRGLGGNQIRGTELFCVLRVGGRQSDSEIDERYCRERSGVRSIAVHRGIAELRFYEARIGCENAEV